jgi:ABC-type multidrug transport system ATPase subunit
VSGGRSLDGEPGALLSAEGLEVRYHGGPDPAVRGVALRLGPGEGLLVCGPPGAGKTSLLRGLLGLVPHGGTVRLPGAGRVGYGPQGDAFAQGLRVDETARMVAAARRVPEPGAAAGQALERAGLGYVTRWRTSRLDAEGVRRLSLALAIAGDPDLVLLDDPWTLSDTLHEIARARGRGAAVLATATAPAGLAPALGGRVDMVDGEIR